MTSTTYSDDYAPRLASVNDGTYSANYAYIPNSSFVDTDAFMQGATPEITVPALALGEDPKLALQVFRHDLQSFRN